LYYQVIIMLMEFHRLFRKRLCDGIYRWRTGW